MAGRNANGVNVIMIKFDPQELEKFRNQDDVEDILLGVAKEVAEDANKMAGGDAEYQAEVWRERRTRAVANVVNRTEGAMRYEAEHGTLARAALQDRK